MINTEELKSIQLEILTKFAETCDKNGLRYCLSGGSLLGAIRHKGFIPWDDDIDVSMPRPDYMRLVEQAHTIFDENLYLSTFYHQKGYYHPFARLSDTRTVFRETLAQGCELGVNIDIFPIDGLPLRTASSNLHFFRLDIWHALRSLSLSKKMSGKTFLRSFAKIPVMLFARVLGADLCLKQIERLALKYDFEKSEYVAAIVSGHYSRRERIDKPSFDRYCMVDFEGRKFNAPVGYEQYLKNLYGDYMQPPPENKRISEHHFEAYWK